MKLLRLILVMILAGLLRAQSVVQSNTGICTNCSSLTISYPVAFTNGNTSLVTCGYSGTRNGPPLFSDSLGGLYANQDSNGLTTSRGDAAGGGRFMFVNVAWVCNSLGGSGVTVTCNAVNNEGSINMSIQEVSGLPAACIVKSGTGTPQSGNGGCVGGCSSVLTPGSVLAPVGVFMETAVWEEADGSTAPTCSPFTFRTSVYNGGASPASTQIANCDKINTDPINAQSNTYTFSSNTGSWEGITLAFTAAPTTAHARRKSQVY